MWAPNARAVSVIGDFNGWNGRAHPLTRARGFLRHLGRRSSPASAAARSTSTTSSRSAGGYRVEKSRSVRLSLRAAAAHRIGRLGSRATSWGDEEWMQAPRAASTRCDCAMVHLRGASGLLAARARGWQSLAQLSRARAAAGRLRRSTWASRTSSSCPSWSIRSTAPGAIRSPATLRRPRATARRRIFMYLIDQPAPARHRRDSRLGAVALPERRARPCVLRRHASLRARRSAPGLSPGVEQLDLQLRPRRSAQLPRAATRSSG